MVRKNPAGAAEDSRPVIPTPSEALQINLFGEAMNWHKALQILQDGNHKNNNNNEIPVKSETRKQVKFRYV